MFLILEGEGELRFGDGALSDPQARRDRLPDRRRRGGAPDHQHRHDDHALSRALDTRRGRDVRIPGLRRRSVVTAGKRGERGLRKMFRAETTVDYYDREKE